MTTTRWATVRTRIIVIPARIAATERRLVLRPPTHRPWLQAWEQLYATAPRLPTPIDTRPTCRQRPNLQDPNVAIPAQTGGTTTVPTPSDAKRPAPINDSE